MMSRRQDRSESTNSTDSLDATLRRAIKIYERRARKAIRDASSDEAADRVIRDFSPRGAAEMDEMGLAPSDVLMALCQVFASAGLKAALTLVPPKDVAATMMFDRGAAPDEYFIGWGVAFAEIKLARRYCTSTSAMYERCMDLVTVVRKVEPNEQARRFMRGIAECYVQGLRGPSVILCRSTLESALADRLDRAGLPHPSTLKAKIETAKLARWFTPEEAQMAMNVLHRGNTAVHNDPDATQDVIGTIDLTMRLVDRLITGPTRAGRP